MADRDGPFAVELGLLLGSPVVSATAVRRGFTNNARWLVGLGDGRTVFVKQAVDPITADWLRVEHRVYEQLQGPWLPDMLAWQDGARTVLVLEDLSTCLWPPPWPEAGISAVRAALADISAHPPPPGLRRAVDSNYAEGGWPEVALDPAPFLNLGLCSEPWLARALPRLLTAADFRLLDGAALCHLDVRSDNVCLRNGHAILVDWNLAAVGNPEFDLAFWLPSLHAEGGPPPAEVADVTPGIVAIVAGFFASRAGLPTIPAAPDVRQIQRLQLTVALPWAVQALGLPTLDPSGG
jgi:Phosphotransferase enzyme family